MQPDFQQGFQPDMQACAAALDLSLDARQERSLLALMVQMLRWNKTYNLTALRTSEQIWVQHVLDSLSVLAPMRQFLAAQPDAETQSDQGIKLVDVGCGAGLPGMVIAIMQPQWQVFCVDAVEKKTAFVRHMRGVLALPNLHAVHGRIEQLPGLEAQFVISRAFASLPDFVRLAGRHAAPQGRLLAMKGAVPDAEIRELHQMQDQDQPRWRVGRTQALHVPHLDARRCLVWIHRQENA